MASQGVLFIVVTAGQLSKVETSIRDVLIPSARERVRVISDASAKEYKTDIGYCVARDIIAIMAAYPPCPGNRLLIERDVKASIVDLSGWWEAEDFGNLDINKLTPAALAREIKTHFKAECLDWRTHAQEEVKKFDGPPANLEMWLQQFSALGFPKIGQKIAAQLRVMRITDLSHVAFAQKPADIFGIERANCYVEDDDEGGSWTEIKSLLVHGVEKSTVRAIRWDKKAKTIIFPDVAVDEFVIYEDGLWSGSEAVRRLRAIAANPPNANVVFRFGVVTDFGLRVVRQAIRSLNLNAKVRIDASASETIIFLEKELAEHLNLGSSIAPEEYYSALHNHVKPLAFGITDDWTEEETVFCESVGDQLARNWLKGRIAPEELANKASLFALGAGRFASTVIFSRSVPKVCLPLLWLDGNVAHDTKSVQWRPLFIDARRVSDQSLLYMP